MKKHILISLSLLVLAVAFQNCGEIALRLPSKPPKVTVGSMPLKTSMCSPQGVTFGAPMKILFIVDMSMSNLGVLRTSVEEIGNEVTTNYCIDTGEPDSTCSGENATVVRPTDLQGERFDAIKDFIDTCGGSNVEYSIVGFSNQTHTVAGNTCLSPFQSSSEAIIAVDALKAQQDSDYANKQGGSFTGFSQDIPYNLQNATSYQVALDCMKTKLEEDILLLPFDEKPVYSVFFVTDGRSTDLANIQAGYNQILQDLNLTVQESEASGFNLYPLFYKSDSTAEEEVAEARQRLDTLAQIINPDVQTTVISDFLADENPLCAQLEPGTEVNYELKHLYAVNISALRSGSILQKDSDMDGISDQEEVSKGLNPLDPRSSGVFDSLCLRYSANPSACQTLKASLQCTEERSGVGFTDCDLKFAERIFSSRLSLLDSDKDQIVDFVEVVKGLHPATDDAQSQPFFDGFTNFEKIVRGLDTKSSLNVFSVSADEMTQLDFALADTNCSTGSKYDYSLSRISLAETEMYTDSLQSILDLSHEKDENIILIFSYWRALGDLDLSHRLYVQKMKLKYGQDEYSLEDRKFLGEF